MTPEHQPHQPSPEIPEPERDRRVEPLPEHKLPGHESITVTREVIDRLTDGTDKLRVLEGVLKNGSPFAAYLTLPDIDPHDPKLIDRFKDVYIDSYGTLDLFIDDQIEDLGWDRALEQFLNTEGIPQDVLHWDREALVRQISSMYDIREIDDWWHFFDK